MQKISTWCFFCLRKIWQVTAITLVLVAVLLSILKYSLPYANQYKSDFEGIIAQQFGVELYIGSITAAWQNTGPALVLENISFQPNDIAPVDLLIAETRLQINLWQSLLDRQVRSSYFVLNGVTASVNTTELLKQQKAQTDTSGSSELDLIEGLFLGNIGHFALENSLLEIYLQNGQRRSIAIENVSWQNKDQKHQGQGRISLPGIAENSLDVIIDLYGEQFSSAFGELYIAGKTLSLAPLLTDLTPDHITKLKSDVNFELWARIDEQMIKSLQLEWQPSSLSWQYQQQEQRLAIESGSLRWQPQTGGWQLDSSHLKLSTNQKAWPDLGIHLDKSAAGYQAQVNHLNLALLRQIAQFESLNSLSPFIARQPSGMLEQTYLQFKDESDWLIQLKGAELGWNNLEDIPGMQGLSLTLALSPERGRIEISGEDNYLLTGNLFSQAIAYQQLNLDFDLQKQSNGWQVTSDNIWLHNQDLSLGGELALDLGQDKAVELYLEVMGPQATLARQYYPRGYMPQGTIDYLNGAIKGGVLDKVRLLWQGKIADFPYSDNNGKFEVRADVVDGVFQFQPNWPTINDLVAELVFTGERMDIYSQQGELVNLALGQSVTVSIADLADASLLTVDIDTQAQAQTLAPFFDGTPLAKPLGSVLKVVQGNGLVKGKVHLAIGLDNPQVIASGSVDLNSADMYISQPGLPLTQVNGILRFENSQIELQGATANWLGLPLSFSVEGVQKDKEYQLNVQLAANWPVEEFIGKGSGLLTGYLTDDLPLAANLDLSFPESGFNYQATIHSNLEGLTSLLPPPYAKSADQQWNLTGTVIGDEISNLIRVGIDDKLFFNGFLANDTGKITRAHLVVAQKDLGINQQDFDVTIALPHANLNQWIPFIDHIIEKSQQSQQHSFMPSLGKIQGNVAEVDLSGIVFNQLDFKLDNFDQSTQLKLMAKELRAEVSIPKVLAQRPIYVEADYLRINLPNTESEAQPDANTDWLKSLPSIRFNCADCKVGSYQLDRVILNLDPGEDGILISDLIIDKTEHTLKAKGEWRAGITSLFGQFTSDDIGELFDEFDLTSSIKDSRAQASLNLNWQGTPYEFNTTSLSGDLKLDLGEGHLSEVSDGGARVFSLLSLDSLVRKLKLDFRDVFAKGFFYNSLKGSLQIEKGIARTSDTKIDGVPADISIKGYADLNTKKIDYDLAVAPEVTSSIPVIVAWMVNPVTGLAALAIDKVIHSARVISEINFKINGTMDEPIVTELGRKSREVALPQVANDPPTIEQPQP
ncbi:hypothetical protein PULV_a3212 [Pseudoalteromonas ulvae UL12]|uniref:YhdP family protein n=1 Tax=Pseudoalteromonas ulvae TaxID=107327 RepID=UPI00186B5A03|nr:YhdP family protein [Pseudoalteromonas ulvae]MBE0364921.1 hypothetical protein [Pseudoalteromonas ulvae UL12]